MSYEGPVMPARRPKRHKETRGPREVYHPPVELVCYLISMIEVGRLGPSRKTNALWLDDRLEH